MSPCVVNSRPHPGRFRCHHPALASFLSPFLSFSYKRPLPQPNIRKDASPERVRPGGRADRRFRPYRKGSLCLLPRSCSSSGPLFSCGYKRLLSYSFSFDTVTNARGVYPILLAEYLKCSLKLSFSGCALPSLFSFLASTAFHNSFPSKRFRTLPSSVSCNSFICHYYENCRVTSFKPEVFLFPRHALYSPSSLFSLFAPRAFHNSFLFRRICTLPKNCRVWSNNSHSGTRHSPLATFSPSPPRSPRRRSFRRKLNYALA